MYHKSPCCPALHNSLRSRNAKDLPGPPPHTPSTSALDIDPDMAEKMMQFLAAFRANASPSASPKQPTEKRKRRSTERRSRTSRSPQARPSTERRSRRPSYSPQPPTEFLQPEMISPAPINPGLKLVNLHMDDYTHFLQRYVKTYESQLPSFLVHLSHKIVSLDNFVAPRS